MVLDAVLGNVGTVVAFRVGARHSVDWTMTERWSHSITISFDADGSGHLCGELEPPGPLPRAEKVTP